MVLEDLVHKFYMSLFDEDANVPQRPKLLNGFSPISNQLSLMLTNHFSEEVKRAIFDMTPFKASGIDGFQAGFYQHSWDVVGSTLCNFVLDFLYTGLLSDNANDTILVLIPKSPHPEQISHLRPIILNMWHIKLSRKQSPTG